MMAMGMPLGVSMRVSVLVSVSRHPESAIQRPKPIKAMLEIASIERPNLALTASQAATKLNRVTVVGIGHISGVGKGLEECHRATKWRRPAANSH